MFGKAVSFFSPSNYTVGNLEREGHKFMSPGKVRIAFHAIRTNVWQDIIFFSLFPTTLLATWKGKDTNLCHLERLELLFMQYRPMFGKTVTFSLSFQLLCWQPGKVRIAFHAMYIKFFLEEYGVKETQIHWGFLSRKSRRRPKITQVKKTQNSFPGDIELCPSHSRWAPE